MSLFLMYLITNIGTNFDIHFPYKIISSGSKEMRQDCLAKQNITSQFFIVL